MSSGEVSCDEQPSLSHENELLPTLSKLGALMGTILLFIMHSGGVKYDAYFFTPALLALDESEFHDTGFFDFFVQDFSLEEHAKDFQFSDSETKEEFAKRFFSHIAAAQNVPANICSLAAKFAKGFKVHFTEPNVNGFIKPCPLYPFVRAITMLAVVNKEIRGIDMKSLEVVAEFLLKEFDPKAYGIEDEGNVHDIVATLEHGFGDNRPLSLTDGTSACQCNKELLECLAINDALPENVRHAISVILPCF